MKLRLNMEIREDLESRTHLSGLRRSSRGVQLQKRAECARMNGRSRDRYSDSLRSILLGLSVIAVLVLGNWGANGQRQLPSGGPQRQGNFGMMGSPAYRQEVSRFLLQEANLSAAELSLPDNLPISAENISRLMIYPPRLAKNAHGIGSVITSNYIYSVTCAYKFSGVTRAHLQLEDNQLKTKYILPMDQMDTNAAFQLATHYLSLASMDVTALNRDCKIHITTSICPDYEHFTPLYYISWVKRKERFGNAASVEVFLPDKSLRQLHVYKPEYILSQPVEITDSEFVNLPTNAPPGQIRSFGLPPPGMN
jgi:hypothetical protein